MRGDHGQNARVVPAVSIDVVVAVATNGAAAEHAHSNIIIARDHRMREPKNCTVNYLEAVIVVADNGIAHHDGGGRAAHGDSYADDEESTMNVVVGNLAITMVTLSDAPGVAEAMTLIPKPLLFVITLLSTPVTTVAPMGEMKIPVPMKLELTEAIVFDTEKLLDVLGEILIPPSRMTQFSMARFPPVLNRMPNPPPSPLDGQAAQVNAVVCPGMIVMPLPEEIPMAATPTPSLTMLIALVMVTGP